MKTILFLYLFLAKFVAAQTYDLLIKGGRIVDPANQIELHFRYRHIRNKIVRVARDIDATQARKTVVDATGSDM